MPLSIVDGLYFSMVITTTVGYGHAITPVTPGGRVFTMYYSIIGLVLFALAATQISSAYSVLRWFPTRTLPSQSPLFITVRRA